MSKNKPLREKEKYIIIGKIISAHGNRGEIKVKPLTESAERFYQLEDIVISHEKYKITRSRIIKDMVILKLEDINQIIDTKDLIGKYIEIERNKAIKLPKGSYFVHEIIGLEVYFDNLSYLGQVSDIIKTGSNDVYVVIDECGKEILIPAIKDIVKSINLDGKKIIIKNIEGLM